MNEKDLDNIFGEDTSEGVSSSAPVTALVPVQNPIMIPSRVCGENERYELAKALTDQMLEVVSAPEAYVMLKHAEHVVKLSIEELKELTVMRIEGKGEMVLGADLKLKRAVEWEYDDPELEQLEAQKKEIAEKIKVRQKFLQGLKSEVADTTTGEIAKPAKLVKDGQTIAVTLPK